MNQKYNYAVSFEKPGDIAWLLSPMGESKVDDINKLCQSISSVQYKRLRRMRYVGEQTTSYVPKLAARSSVNRGYSLSGRIGSPGNSSVSWITSLFGALGFTSFSATQNGVPLPSMIPFTEETLSKLKIVSSDICFVQAEGIVSSQGTIARSIERRRVSDLQLAEGIQGVQLQVGDQRNDVQVYQLFTGFWNGADSMQILKENIKMAFEALSQNKVKTMAFPAIGTGALNYPADVVAITMIDTLLQCLEETSAVSEVTIAIHPSAPHVYEIFKNQEARHHAIAIVPLRVPVYTPSRRATVTFTALRLSNVMEAKDRLWKELSLHMSSVNWASSPHNSAIGRLSQEELDNIYERAISCNVMVVFDLSGNNITLDGQKDDVEILRKEINQVLQKKPPTTFGMISLPPYWDQLAVATGNYEVELPKSSDEFKTVSFKFHETCNTDVTISKIKRIQNEHLYTQYQIQKNKVLKDLGGDEFIEVERELWHGTSAESTKRICANWFNRSFAGKNGVVYGVGTYFSLTSGYSISYYSDKYNKCVILAKVATGRYMLGNRGTDGTNLPQGYHSTVNSLDNPDIFVVYHDAAAYPEYVVEFC